MIAYLDCFSGISGDMLLGALVDAGLDLAALRDGLASLPLSGYTIEADRVQDHGISGTAVRVHIHEEQHAHRRLPDILALLDASSLPEPARAGARAVFERLAAAEATIHGTTPDEVTFHEVGAVDSIVDTVGVVLGLHLLGIDRVYCSELPLTSGRARSAHGPLPVPAPATVEVLKGTGAVWRPLDAEGELVTPTGAVVAATFARFERPAMRISYVGYGFGQKKLAWANCLRVLIGDDVREQPSREMPGTLDQDDIVVIETNIDNMTGEALGWLMDRLLAAGALDVTYSPLQMKKNRPATLLTVLATPEAGDDLAGLLLRESTTLGVRLTRANRLKAQRRIEVIETPLGEARIKVKEIDGVIISAAPEYDDCKAIAERQGLPLENVVAHLTHAARSHFGLSS
jgi:uncharacterized protein (TIGR00299 family) protein